VRMIRNTENSHSRVGLVMRSTGAKKEVEEEKRKKEERETERERRAKMGDGQNIF
jgi:hypothetical protein